MEKKSLVSGLIINRYSKEVSILDRNLLMVLIQKEDSCSKMYFSMAKWNQLSMTNAKEIARCLNITDLVILLMKTVKHL